MGVTFTKEQQQVIDLRNRNILVSAAAGSGKTAVLVERIITRLTKDENPLDVDRLLIVTFTEAAASEMKERIHQAIEKALEDQPENVHLQRQATLIHQAQITTIHKFCLSVIRDYFYTIDLDPGFRVGEEGELKLLKHDVLEKVLEHAYTQRNAEFTDFVECFASGRDDRKLEELILQLYEFSRSYTNPDGWLSQCVSQYQIASVEELEQTEFVKNILEETKRYLGDMQKLLEFGISVCEEEDGPAVYGGTLHSDRLVLEKLRREDTFAGMQTAISQVKWQTLTACKDPLVSEKKIAQVKHIREEVKDGVKELVGQYFYDTAQEMQKSMLAAKVHMQVLVHLVREFAKEFQEVKQSKNLIDFHDMEHYALRILTEEKDGRYVPSVAAENYQQKFEEVMIDEYQDSNLVQEAILTGVSKLSKGIHNIFMVGDVKQSIYSFRLSRPKLFMEKFHSYDLEESKNQRIDLHKNFRSRAEVLESTNFVFEQIMTSAFGGISYDENAALYVGASYEEREGNRTEVLLLEATDSKAEERMEAEAEMVAERIWELVEHHTVLDKKTGLYRDVNFGDIVILTRSLKGWGDTFSRVLKRAGIPTYTSSGEGYFQTTEIQLILNCLKILDNPRQDIPFASVLTSMFVALTDEELALVRSHAKGKTLYDCVSSYAQDGESEKLRKKTQDFLCTLEEFRGRVPYVPIHTLISQLLDRSGYGDYAATLPGGRQRAANLDMLVEKAVAFEKTSYKGLFHFVRYIEQLQKYDVDYGEAGVLDEKVNMVNIMSIHKSKGLEFPIVFLCGIGKKFNLQDIRKSIVMHAEEGIGMDDIDSDLRIKTPTLLKKKIQKNMLLESAAEELRILYVAMTRAKEKLILTGNITNLEKELDAVVPVRNCRETALPYYTLTKATRYLDWILAALFRNRCMAKVLETCDIQVPYGHPLFGRQVPVEVKVTTLEDLAMQEAEEVAVSRLAKNILERWDTKQVYDSDMKEQLESQFSYKYPYDTVQGIKQKLSVSELKKRAYMEEGDEMFEEEEVMPLLPKFLQEKETLTGALRGTAYHKVLELLDFSKEYDKDSLTENLAKMVSEGLIEQEAADCIRVEEILNFLSSDIGKRVQKATRQDACYKEQPFVLGIPANIVYPSVSAEEDILVQGIIDLYFEEEGELVLLDYKTDKVFSEEELMQRYLAQLQYYAEALERLTGKVVKEKKIYSFALQKEICYGREGGKNL